MRSRGLGVLTSGAWRSCIAPAAWRSRVSRNHVFRVPALRLYHFGTSQYDSAFGSLPEHDSRGLREATVKYLETAFDGQVWFDDPIQTIIDGHAAGSTASGKLVETYDAAGRVNGKQLIADDVVLDKVKAWMQSMSDAANESLPAALQAEYTSKMRAVEARLLSHEVACQLVGNQAVDFLKQDGITEIEESLQANQVERKLNDFLAQDAAGGKVEVNRAPVLVACVSNFSNFLDMFRKTVRHLELGVPCLVLSRSNTGQHCYRWFRLLLAQCQEHNYPAHLLAFASCSLDQQRLLMRSFPASPVHFTGSREVARKIKEVAPRTLASTGGPNTMVVTGLTPQIAAAVRMSACIENSVPLPWPLMP